MTRRLLTHEHWMVCISPQQDESRHMTVKALQCQLSRSSPTAQLFTLPSKSSIPCCSQSTPVLIPPHALGICCFLCSAKAAHSDVYLSRSLVFFRSLVKGGLTLSLPQIFTPNPQYFLSSFVGSLFPAQLLPLVK